MLEASYHEYRLFYLYSSGGGNCQSNIVCLSLDAPWRGYDLIRVHTSNAVEATSDDVGPTNEVL